VLEEAHRLLRPGGRLVAVHHVAGTTRFGRLYDALWRRIARLIPGVVPAGPVSPLEGVLAAAGLDPLRSGVLHGVYRTQVVLAERPRAGT
jgi:SAM-dependent methyltransferase